MIVMKLSFEHENEKIEFTVTFSKRKTLGIEVRPPGVVKVAAPLGASKDRIMAVVLEKEHWIVEKRKQMKAVAESNAQPESYETGAEILFLGKRHTLQVVEDFKFDIPVVEVKDQIIRVYAASDNKILVKNAVEKWLGQMTKYHIEKRIHHFQKHFKIAPSRVIIKEQKRRWGSCNSHRELRFNRHCIKSSERALDYLVVHEMSHMVHMNHSKDFWVQVESIIPDYKTARAELKKTII